jgi:outer membrane protein
VTFRARIRPLVSFLVLAALAAPVGAADNAAVPPAAAPAAGSVTWTVADVTAAALKSHPLILQSQADVAAAAARKGQAQSGWYPAVILSTGYSRARTFSAQTEKSTTVPNEFARGDLSWTLSDFGRTGGAVERADANAAASRENAATVREDVVFAAKVTFYDVLRAGKTIEFRRENLRQRESLHRQAQAFFDAGVKAKIDLVRAEANLYDARAQVSQAENDLRVARITLLQRMGVDGPADFQLSGELSEQELPGTMADWIAEAERNRPELRGLLEKKRAAGGSLRAASAGYLPYLVGTAGYGYAADDAPLQENYSAAVTLSLPLFSGFQTREQVREAQATVSSAGHEYSEAKRRVRLQVESSAYGAQEAKERMATRKKEREASEENLRLATARYEVGAGDIIEMIDAQTQMVRSDTESVNTAFDYAVSVASLLRAMGR